MREEFLNRNALVVGYGISGRGAERALEAVGARVSVLDESTGKAVLDAEYVSRFDLIVTSPSVAADHRVYQLADEAGIEIYGEIELGARLFDGKLIGVTGTNGKTTTVKLLGKMLKRAGFRAAVCGNVGVSFAETAVFDAPEIAVVELSSFQLERVSFLRPDIAAITNITPDHLDRHRTFSAYAAAKRNIARYQTAQDTLILSQDDIPLEALEGFRPNSNVLYTSVRGKVRGAYLLGDTVYYFDEPVCKRAAIRLSGLHNVSNCLFAVCAAKLCGVRSHIIAEVLGEFETDDHRIRLVARVRGKNYYNDSKGTNIGATLAAVRATEGTIALILGGKDKGYEFDRLFERLPPAVKYVFAIGETADKICAAADRCGFHLVVQKSGLTPAVCAAAETDAENVLLSPACSSFDMFKDYEERGRVFEQIVAELPR